MPSRFTTGELAVLKIVTDEVRDRGQCARPVDAIAARAGICGRLVISDGPQNRRQALFVHQ